MLYQDGIPYGGAPSEFRDCSRELGSFWLHRLRQLWGPLSVKMPA